MNWLNPVEPIRRLSHKLEVLVHGKLWLQVLIGLGMGLIFGILIGPEVQLIPKAHTQVITEWLALPGYLFLRLLKMIVIPLVMASIIRGIGVRKNAQKLKATGLKLIGFILTTTLIAVGLGFVLAFSIQPGNYVEIAQVNSPLQPVKVVKDFSIAHDLPQMIVNLIPGNPLTAMINNEMLSLVIFSVIIGLAFTTLPNRKISTLFNGLNGILNISMTIVKWGMFLAPFAVFGLTAKMASQVGVDTLIGMSFYALTVITGLLLLLIFYYLIIFIVKKMNPADFGRRIGSVQLLAFSTSSSAAVMPMSIRVAEEELNVDTKTAELVIPIGATMNMAGTALYQSTALIFLAQISGIDLEISQLLFITVTLVASSIGAPGTPGIGMVILATIAGNIGIPLEGMVLIMGLDRILDMMRTTVNVTGDLVACKLLADDGVKL